MAAATVFPMLMLFWPALLGLFMSLAIVGKGLRIAWLPLALGIFLLVAGALSVLVSAVGRSDPSGMFGVVVIYIAGSVLVPAGALFRKWRRRRLAAEGANQG